MVTYYRLRFKSGCVGAWSKDLERIKKEAKLFGATIEEWTANYDFIRGWQNLNPYGIIRYKDMKGR